jgi:hypothetical protein
MADPEGADEGAGIEWGGLPSPALVRAALGLVLGIAVAALGAKLLGEYQFEGAMPYGAGLLFGLVIGELVVEVGRNRSAFVAFVAGAASAGGLLWAGYIASGNGLEPLKTGVWIAAAIGFVAAAGRTHPLGRGRRRPTA